MGLFSRGSQSSRNYPNAGISVTGDSGRFRRAKTKGARKAGAEAEEFEHKDRKRDKRGDTNADWINGKYL